MMEGDGRWRKVTEGGRRGRMVVEGGESEDAKSFMAVFLQRQPPLLVSNQFHALLCKG